MRFGNFSTFGIESVHEPLANENGWVFGRMCLWLGGCRVGDFDEPTCLLNVTAGHFEDVLKHLPDLENPDFDGLTDEQIFERLRSALYGDGDKSTGQVMADAHRYRRFDFLTHGGELFDRTMSFISLSSGDVRILFDEPSLGMVSVAVAVPEFISTLEAFLAWLRTERQKHAS